MPPGTISERMIQLLQFLFKVQNDTRFRLGTAHEQAPRSGPLRRIRVISNRSANQTLYAGMTDSSSARPPDRKVARLRRQAGSRIAPPQASTARLSERSNRSKS